MFHITEESSLGELYKVIGWKSKRHDTNYYPDTPRITFDSIPTSYEQREQLFNNNNIYNTLRKYA